MMTTDFDLRSGRYWRQLGWGLLVGLISAAGAFAFIAIMDFGQDLLWPESTDWSLFSGSWVMVAIMVISGLLVGILHRYTKAAEMDVFDAVDKGEMDPKPVPASLLVSLISLIGGFALGPEVPTGMLAAGFSTWVSKWRKLSADMTRTNVLSGVSAAYAGLFSSPYVVLIMLLESAHLQTLAYYGTLLIAGLAATVGFSFFFFLAGDTFSSLLGLLALPAYDLRVWHLGVAMLLGVLAVPVGLLVPICMAVFRRLLAPLETRPILRGLIGGLVLGLLAYAVPISIGLGTKEMVTVSQNAADIGLGLLLVFVLAKIIALSGALAFGFIGGPIFPLLFVGTTAGSIVHLLLPALPPALVLGCMIVAVPAAIVPIPLALVAIGVLIIGLSPSNILPLVLAALVAFSITHGLKMGAKKTASPEDGL